jgi:hypothetical protein
MPANTVRNLKGSAYRDIDHSQAAGVQTIASHAVLRHDHESAFSTVETVLRSLKRTSTCVMQVWLMLREVIAWSPQSFRGRCLRTA